MSKLLSELLHVRDQEFRQFVEKLEHACLRPGVDIRLSAEIITKSREKIRVLGLDNGDTTARELFYALRARLTTDDKKLNSVLKIPKSNPEKTSKILAETAKKLSKNEKSLSLTSAGTSRLLKAVPPRKTMRVLKYRSLVSVLKREDPRLLYAIATKIEDKSWKSQIHAKMRRLDAKDIAWQQVNCASLPTKWHKKLSASWGVGGIYFSNAETGTVCVLPVIKDLRPGATALSLGLLLQAVQKVAIDSLPYRQQAFTHGYNVALPELSNGFLPPLVSVHGLLPSWRAVYELLSKGHLKEHPIDSELLTGDMLWQSTEMKLASLVPEMDFWVDTHYLAVKGNPLPTSLHITDVAASLVAKKAFGEHDVNHFEASLWNEIQIRYLSEDVLTHSLVHQLMQRNRL